MKSYLPKILITGCTGQIGSALRNQVLAKDFQLMPFNHAALDITDIASIANAINHFAPDLIINAAAFTAVDKAEQEREQCMRVNQLGPLNLAIACRKEQLPLIHLSTDYIFDGKESLPYQEDAEANPLNFYGKSKLLGEEAIREECERHVILRLSGIFSEYGNNFLKTMLKLAAEKKELRVVADQVTCPTYADDIANVILTICKNLNVWGTFHYCSSKPTSWYEFAEFIIEQAKHRLTLKVEEVKAISTNDYIALAERPMHALLDCSKIKKVYGIKQSHWEDGVKKVLSVF